MTQTQILYSDQPSSPAYRPEEYVIYAYSYFEEKKLGYNRWKRLAADNDADAALSRASNYFSSGRYQKVEIKKKKFDPFKKKYDVSTYRIYKNRRFGDLFIPVAIGLIVFAMAGYFYLNF